MFDIIIIVVCAMCGYACGKFVEKHIKSKGLFYSDLVKYVGMLKINIEGKQIELPQFDRDFAVGCGSEFAEYLRSRTFKVKLPSYQKKEICDFFNGLNCVGLQQLTNHINTYSAVFEEMRRKQYDNEVAKSAVYVKLAVLAGVMVGIVLI